MPQTILALLALMVAMLFTLQQQRRTLSTQQVTIRNEFAVQSTGVARGILSAIGGNAFDEAVDQLSEGETLSSSGELTSEACFGSNCSESGIGNDVDDFQGSPGDSLLVRKVQRRDSETGVLNTYTLNFGAEVELAYVEPGDPNTKSSIKTKAKRATVRVWSEAVSVPDTIELSRPYFCGSKCDW